MGKFTSKNQPVKNGRPIGSKNKRSQFTDTMTNKALEQLEIALNEGQQWAIETVLKRTHPQLKPVTPVNSIDGDYLTLKMKEISEFEARIQVLESER